MVKDPTLGCFLVCLLLGSMPLSGDGQDGDSWEKPQWRRPVAVALVDGGRWLVIANQSSGSVSVIDTNKLRKVSEIGVGRKLSDLAGTPEGQRLLTVDEEANELLVLDRQESTLKVQQRLPVSPAPVSVQVQGDGSRAVVASLWSRRLTIVELRAGTSTEVKPAQVRKTIDLPFAPRQQLLVPGTEKLIVADAFGGRLGVVDLGRGAVESLRTLPAHNIRGLALSDDGKELLVAHQILNGQAQTTFDDVHWGNLMTNNLRILTVASVLDPKADLLRGSRLVQLGDVNQGAGDPAALVLGSAGTAIVALGGTSEVTWGPLNRGNWNRLRVGRRPTALAVSADRQRAFVAGTFADSVTVVDLPERKIQAEISLGQPPEASASQRGEMLFFDARLSHDGWLSCHSCHTDGHTNGLLNDNLGDGSFGAPKRVLSLLGVKDTGPWAWNGSMASLSEQIRKSILTTMHGAKPSEEEIRDLEAYLRTLPPPPPSNPITRKSDEAAARRGQEVFHKQNCGSCHPPPTYTSAKTYNVGLTDEVGNTLFNPPSLRGVGQGGPYFHDNRAATLSEVFTRHRHQLKTDLNDQQIADLLVFLRSL